MSKCRRKERGVERVRKIYGQSFDRLQAREGEREREIEREREKRERGRRGDARG